MVKKTILAFMISASFVSLYGMEKEAKTFDHLSILPTDIKKIIIAFILDAETPALIQLLEKPYSLAQMIKLKSIMDERKQCYQKLVKSTLVLPLVNKNFRNLFKDKEFIHWLLSELAVQLKNILKIHKENAQLKVSELIKREIAFPWLEEKILKQRGFIKRENGSTAQGYSIMKALMGFARAFDRYITSSPAFTSFMVPGPKLALPGVLSEECESLIQAIISTTNRIQAGDQTATYGNVLLWGEPGRGTKYLAAKYLAYRCGFILIQFDISEVYSKPSEEVSKKFDELFAQIEQSSNKLMIYVSEADIGFKEKAINNLQPFYQIFFKLLREESNKHLVVLETFPTDIVHTDIQSPIKAIGVLIT